jgi:hypothetical protein
MQIFIKKFSFLLGSIELRLQKLLEEKCLQSFALLPVNFPHYLCSLPGQVDMLGKADLTPLSTPPPSQLPF